MFGGGGGWGGVSLVLGAAESITIRLPTCFLFLTATLQCHLLSEVFPESQAPLGSAALCAHLTLAVLNHRMATAPPTSLAEGIFSPLHPSCGPVLVMALMPKPDHITPLPSLLQSRPLGLVVST